MSVVANRIIPRIFYFNIWFSSLRTGLPYIRALFFESQAIVYKIKFTPLLTHCFLNESFPSVLEIIAIFITAYSVFFMVGLLCSMQIPFVGFQPVRTSEHMAAAGLYLCKSSIYYP